MVDEVRVRVTSPGTWIERNYDGMGNDRGGFLRPEVIGEIVLSRICDCQSGEDYDRLYCDICENGVVITEAGNTIINFAKEHLLK